MVPCTLFPTHFLFLIRASDFCIPIGLARPPYPLSLLFHNPCMYGALLSSPCKSRSSLSALQINIVFTHPLAVCVWGFPLGSRNFEPCGIRMLLSVLVSRFFSFCFSESVKSLSSTVLARYFSQFVQQCFLTPVSLAISKQRDSWPLTNKEVYLEFSRRGELSPSTDSEAEVVIIIDVSIASEAGKALKDSIFSLASSWPWRPFDSMWVSDETIDTDGPNDFASEVKRVSGSDW